MLAQALVYPTIPSKNIDAARDFYVDVLGLTHKDTGDDGSYILEAGDGSIVCLYPSQFAGTNEATAIAFQVNDLRSEVDALAGKGVSFEEYDLPNLKTDNGIATFGDNHAAWFKDPDGNIVGVFQPARVLARS